MIFKKKETVYKNDASNPIDEEGKTIDEIAKDADKVTVEDSEDKTVYVVEKTKSTDISLFGIGFLIFAGTIAVCSVLDSISGMLSSRAE